MAFRHLRETAQSLAPQVARCERRQHLDGLAEGGDALREPRAARCREVDGVAEVGSGRRDRDRFARPGVYAQDDPSSAGVDAKANDQTADIHAVTIGATRPKQTHEARNASSRRATKSRTRG